MKTKVKKFDCVAMMHRAAARVYEETKGMTIAEELAYWKKHEVAFEKRRAALKSRRARSSPARPRKAATGGH